MRRLTYITFISAAIFFILFGLSFHLIYGKRAVHKIAFDYYNPSNLLHNLKFLVAMNPLFSVPFNIITILEIFEKIPVFDKLLKDDKG